jgi:hypothetical protein
MLERDGDHGLRSPVDDGLESVGRPRVDVVARALVDVRGLRGLGSARKLDRDPGALAVLRLERRDARLARGALLDEVDADRPVRVLAAAAFLVAAAAGCEQDAKDEECGYRRPRTQSP